MYFYGMMGGLLLSVVIILWWVFFSRAPWVDRAGAIVLMIVAILATSSIVHISIRTAMMGRMLPVYAVQVLCPALVFGALVGSRGSTAFRRASIAAAILSACGALALVRTDGVSGSGSQLAWRWSKTAEERLLAQGEEPLDPRGSAVLPGKPPAATEPAPSPDKPVGNEPPKPQVDVQPDARDRASTAPALSERSNARVEGRVEWSGFRGSNRDGVIRGVQIETDWSKAPPVEMWRRPIGPGWSSFAVQGEMLYTQEQRGEDELVAAYHMGTGKPAWRHRENVRFWESNGGAGPRGTPTLSNGRLNALDAGTGAVIWSRNVSTDAGKPVPMWGFSSSPLVEGDEVIVAASGKLAAYDAATGKPRWFGPARPGSYSSPHRFTASGVTQILLLHGAGVVSVAPSDGTVLWEHAWEATTPIVQPALADGDVLINAMVSTGGLGIRRLSVAQASGWTVEERWTSTGLKPYFNDFVVHRGHAYGFDGSILACIDLANGARKWKGGRYGNGQLVLLADQDLLLVVSEDGELALVKAVPDQFTEVGGRFKAIEGKTWNHPVLVRDVLVVRNGEEMAAFRLSLASRTTTRED
jgi:hypothetical protein